jgi:hypothetical protein
MAEIEEKVAEIEQKQAENKRITKQVKKFMKSVKEFLMSKNGGKIPPEWGCSLMMLETYYSQFIRLTYEIDGLPSLIEQTRYGAAPSPLLKARDTTAVRLESLMKAFGLTMKSAMGMEIVEPVAEESVLDKFLKDKIEKRG